MSSCADISRQEKFHRFLTLKSHDPNSFQKIAPLPMGLPHQIPYGFLQDIGPALSYGLPWK